MSGGGLTRATTAGGEAIAFEMEPFASGTMKDVHRIEDDRYVLAMFREPLTPAGAERIHALVEVYRGRILDGPGGSELAALYRWPRDTVEWRGRVGLIVPAFAPASGSRTGRPTATGSGSGGARSRASGLPRPITA